MPRPRGGCKICTLDPKDKREIEVRHAAGEGSTGIARDFSDVSSRQINYHFDNCDRVDVDQTQAQLTAVAKLLERSGIPIEEVAEVREISVGAWQSFYSSPDGPVVVDLERTGIKITPKWANGPAWPVVQQAKPTIVKRPVTKLSRLGGWQTAVILPDTQIGYRRDSDTGELDPFHDVHALAVALQIIKAVKPDLIINLGDLMDLPEWGTYEQEPAFQNTTQATLDRAHLWLAQQVAAAPNAEIRLLEGNHDRRLEKAIRRNAIASFGLRRAEDPTGWPVLSIPFLLRLDELGVEYVGGYPAGLTWINERLACIHGHKVRSNGSTAATVIDDERVSVIFGHVHRIELQHKTRRGYTGAKQSLAATPGCLCRLDGAVPSVKSSTDPMGKPVLSYENWQQGIAVVEYLPGDKPFNLELVPIIEGEARFRGKGYAA